MKTTKRNGKANGAIKMLEAMVNMLDQNLKGAQGSELLRLQAELDGVRARLRELGA